MKVIRVGVLGTARIARRLIGEMQLVPGLTVKAIASRSPERAAWYAQQLGIETAWGDYQQLVDSPEIDAVYLPLPPSLHATWAERAARQGKHVLVEKPLATNLSEAQHMAAVCESAGVQWLDATAWLHHPRTVAIRRELDEGRLGTLRHLSAGVAFFEPFQDADHRLDVALGGGCLLDLGWYCAGAALWASTEQEGWTTSGWSVDGTWRRVVAQGRMAGGGTIHLECGYDAATHKQLDLVGTERTLVCDDFTRPWLDAESQYRLRDRAGRAEVTVCPGQQEKALLTHWLDAIRGQLDLGPYQAYALRTQLLLETLAGSLGMAHRGATPAGG
jgi:predicted dehydrogenase